MWRLYRHFLKSVNCIYVKEKSNNNNTENKDFNKFLTIWRTFIDEHQKRDGKPAQS